VPALVVLPGVEERFAASLAEAAGADAHRVEPEALEDAVVPGVTIAVLSPATAGVALAQRVHRAAPDATVLFLAGSEAERQELSTTLSITPRIGRHARCLLVEDPSTFGAVVDELSLARRRSAHHRTVEQVRDALDGLTTATADEASRYLGQLFAHAPIGILITDRTGKVRAANPGIEEVVGWAPRHALGRDLASLFAGDEADLARRVVLDCADTGQSCTEVLTRTGPDGDTQHVEVRTAPVDPAHPEVGVIVLLRDETERIEAVEAAEHATRAAQASAERYAALARILQESLLPPDLPTIEGLDVAAFFHPAGDGSQIGGDFYDLFQLSEHEWFAAVGDVCGKGAAAARLTALARYTLRAAATRSADLGRNLDELNAALLRQADEGSEGELRRFVTLAGLRVRPGAGGVAVQVGVGGHPRPLLVRRSGELVEVAASGRLLGMFDEIRLRLGTVALAPGDALVTFTDGVTEARRGQELFGESRLADLVRSLAGRSAAEMVDAIGESVLSFQLDRVRDDVAVLVLTAPGGPSTE
jgi:phosphoserine phosphatase RsbU/P